MWLCVIACDYAFLSDYDYSMRISMPIIWLCSLLCVQLGTLYDCAYDYGYDYAYSMIVHIMHAYSFVYYSIMRMIIHKINLKAFEGKLIYKPT